MRPLAVLVAVIALVPRAWAGVVVDARLGSEYRSRRFYHWNPKPLSVDVDVDEGTSTQHAGTPFGNGAYGVADDPVGDITPSATLQRFAPGLAAALEAHQRGALDVSKPWRAADDVQRVQSTLAACLKLSNPRCGPHADLFNAATGEPSAPPPYAELYAHFRTLVRLTAPLRGNHFHSYHNFSGPWMENHVMRAVFSLPFAAWYPIVPLFLAGTDTVLQRYGAPSRSLVSWLMEQSPSLLRRDTIYLVVSQHDHSMLSLANDCTLYRNVVIASAGGWGNVPVPMLGRPIEYRQPSRPPARRRHLLSFMGTIDASRADSSSRSVTLWEYSRQRIFMLALLRRLGFGAHAPHLLHARSFAFRNKTATGGDISTDSSGGRDDWLRMMTDTAFPLAPRGYGATSFRMYEALQAGRVPLYIWGDVPPLAALLPPPRALLPLLHPSDIEALAEGSDTPGVASPDTDARTSFRKLLRNALASRPELVNTTMLDVANATTGGGALLDAAMRVLEAGSSGVRGADGGAVFPAFESLVEEAAALTIDAYTRRDRPAPGVVPTTIAASASVGTEWLPYRRVKPALWGWGGVGLVTHFSHLGLVARLLCRWFAPLPDAPPAVVTATDMEAYGRRPRDVGVDAAVANALPPYDHCSVGVAAPCHRNGSEAGQCRNAWLADAAAGGKSAHDSWLDTLRSLQQDASATGSSNGDDGVETHPDSMLARMEDRLRVVRDGYFTMGALVGRLAEFVQRPWDSALTCEGKAAAHIAVVEL